jgi:hypothetical protein
VSLVFWSGLLTLHIVNNDQPGRLVAKAMSPNKIFPCMSVRFSLGLGNWSCVWALLCTAHILHGFNEDEVH